MAATYQQHSTITSFQPALYSLYNGSGGGYIITKTQIGGGEDASQSGADYPEESTLDDDVKISMAATEGGGNRKRDCRRNSQDKPETFTCEECGKSVKSRNYLKIHMRIHSGEKPYPCNQCSLSFSIKGNLYKHMRTHSGVKNYACPYCGQMFRDSSSRSRHLRLHTGEMPYRCQECDQNFRYREMYKTHMMSVHGLEENDVTTLPPGKRSKNEQGWVKGKSPDIQLNTVNSLSQNRDQVGINPAKKRKISNVHLKAISKNNVNLSIAAQDNVSSLTTLPGQLSTHVTVETTKSDQGQEVESLNGDEDLSFENTSPDKLMPLELQNQDLNSKPSAIIHIGSKPVMIHRHGSPWKVKRFQCSKCPKAFSNKSQLTRHQKMHKLLTLGTGKHSVVTSSTCSQMVRESSACGLVRNDQSVCVTTPNQAELTTTELPLDLTAVNTNSTCVTGSADQSIQRVDATFPETYLQDSSYQSQTQRGENEETIQVSSPVGKEANATVSTPLSNHAALKTKGKLSVGDDDKVECTVCGQKLAKGTYIKAHMRIHSGEKPHVCKFCGRGFTVCQNLYKHLRTHTGEKNYACPTCGRKFNTSSSRNRHMVIHNGDKPYPCQLCSEQFQYLDELKVHCQKRHQIFSKGSGQVKEFSKNFFLSSSETQPTSDLVITPKNSTSSNLRSTKEKDEHESETVRRLSENGGKQECDKLMFPYDPPAVNCKLSDTNMSLNDLSSRLSQSKYHTAAIEQTALASLESHLSGCGVPQETFNQPLDQEAVNPEGNNSAGETNKLKKPHDLKNHLKTNSDEQGKKLYSCHVCEYSSAFHQELVAHFNIHVSEKRFRCAVCGKQFALKNAMERHKQLHARNKQYQCLICKERFTYLDLLMQHYKKHHPQFDVSTLTVDTVKPHSTENGMKDHQLLVAAETEVFPTVETSGSKEEDTETKLESKPNAKPKQTMVMNYTSLSRSGISHRKQAAPMKLPTITYIAEDVESSPGCSHSDSETNLQPSQNDQESNNTVDIKKGSDEDHYITAINKQNGSDPDTESESHECLLSFKDRESLVIHSQTHEPKNGKDSPVVCEKLHSSLQSEETRDINVPETSSRLPQPEEPPAGEVKSLMERPDANISWPKSVFSAINHISSGHQDVQNFQNRLAASIVSGIRPKECPICFSHFSSMKKLELHMAEHRKNDYLAANPQPHKEINDLRSGSCSQSKLPEAVDLSVQRDTAETPLEIRSVVSSPLPDSQSTNSSASQEENSQTCSTSSESMCTSDKDYKGHSDAPVLKTLSAEKMKDIECRHCLGVFASYKDLQEHMKVHEGQPVFNCPFCSFVFNKQDLLLKHLKEHVPA